MSKKPASERKFKKKGVVARKGSEGNTVLWFSKSHLPQQGALAALVQRFGGDVRVVAILGFVKNAQEVKGIMRMETYEGVRIGNVVKVIIAAGPGGLLKHLPPLGIIPLRVEMRPVLDSERRLDDDYYNEVEEVWERFGGFKEFYRYDEVDF